MTTPSPIPPGMHTLTPHLVCRRAADAIDFYVKAFNATELMRLPGPDGRLMHAQLKIGDSCVMLMDEFPEPNACPTFSPLALKGTPVSLHLYVADADAAFAQAVAAGATVVMPLADMFWGDRYGVVDDPFGHRWSIATHQHDYTPEQVAANFKAACGGGQ